jgi:hypothetical protein
MKTKNYIQLCAILFAAMNSAHAQTNFTKITTGNIVTDKGSRFYRLKQQ